MGKDEGVKELFCQLTKSGLAPASQEYADTLKAFHPNQIVRVKVYGTRKERSVQQNKWVHNMFRHVASNTSDPEWSDEFKVKFQVKMIMKFFEDTVTVIGKQVYFQMRSFAFDRMEVPEANRIFNDVLLICAQKIDVDPSVLEAQAKEAE